MDQLTQLVEQTKALLNKPTASLAELNVVYHCLTGTDCRRVNRILFKLNAFVNNPEHYRRTVEEYYTSRNMANEKRKYRFSPQAGASLITVHDDAGRAINITPQTLTNDRAELLLRRYPQFAHNIELIVEEIEMAPEPEPVQEVEVSEPAAEVAPAPVAEEAPAPEPAPAPKKRGRKASK